MKESRMLRRARQEAELIRLRADILLVLRGRFGVPAQTEFTAALDEIDDALRLESLLNLAATARDIAGFRAGLQTQAATH